VVRLVYRTCRSVSEITRENLERVQNYKTCITINENLKNFIVANSEYPKLFLRKFRKSKAFMHE